MLEGADDSPLLVRTSIYQRLRAAILSCALRPGAQIQERQLAELYQVSKSPIRDALLKLEEQNLIEVMPNAIALTPTPLGKQVGLLTMLYFSLAERNLGLGETLFKGN